MTLTDHLIAFHGASPIKIRTTPEHIQALSHKADHDDNGPLGHPVSDLSGD